MNNISFESDNLMYKKPNFFLKFLSDAFVTVCIIIALFIIFFSFIFVSAPVTGVSMQPTLNANGESKQDIVYINKLLPYSYGDIVVIERPTNNVDVKYIIKRVVGMPGDRIKIMQDEDYKVYLFRNGKKVEEDYIFDAENCDDPHNYGMYATLQQYLDLINNVKKYPNNYPNVVFDDGWLVLQKDQIFVLGDNRGYSEDSSALGPFNKNKVVGRVDFIIPHGVVPFYYFLKYYTGIDLGI